MHFRVPKTAFSFTHLQPASMMSKKHKPIAICSFKKGNTNRNQTLHKSTLMLVCQGWRVAILENVSVLDSLSPNKIHIRSKKQNASKHTTTEWSFAMKNETFLQLISITPKTAIMASYNNKSNPWKTKGRNFTCDSFNCITLPSRWP